MALMDLSAAFEVDVRCFVSSDALEDSAGFELCWVTLVDVAVADNDFFADLLFETVELPF